MRHSPSRRRHGPHTAHAHTFAHAVGCSRMHTGWRLLDDRLLPCCLVGDPAQAVHAHARQFHQHAARAFLEGRPRPVLRRAQTAASAACPERRAQAVHTRPRRAVLRASARGRMRMLSAWTCSSSRTHRPTARPPIPAAGLPLRLPCQQPKVRGWGISAPWRQSRCGVCDGSATGRDRRSRRGGTACRDAPPPRAARDA